MFSGLTWTTIRNNFSVQVTVCGDSLNTRSSSGYLCERRCVSRLQESSEQVISLIGSDGGWPTGPTI
jgi:hypothetical protein